ncbi:hypothetical protein NE237_000290 [Protea cynaroides]|uniref:Uncharacterized protein n=1 Tax=Protea cynaroides TaxID=273540 RepID=A0A9Q0KR97_9MAGN|nr:hypothetical protein NE237_000290 [Protea cynaroides]
MCPRSVGITTFTKLIERAATAFEEVIKERKASFSFPLVDFIYMRWETSEPGPCFSTLGGGVISKSPMVRQQGVLGTNLFSTMLLFEDIEKWASEPSPLISFDDSPTSSTKATPSESGEQNASDDSELTFGQHSPRGPNNSEKVFSADLPRVEVAAALENRGEGP